MEKPKITNKAGLKIFIFFVALGVVRILYYYPQLPQKAIMHWS